MVRVYIVARSSVKARLCKHFGFGLRAGIGAPIDGFEAVFAHCLGNFGKKFFNFFRPAVVLYKLRGIVNHKIRTAVYLIIIWLFEVFFYAVFERIFKILRGSIEAHQPPARLVRIGPELVSPIVVRPHYRKLHLIAVWRLQKSLFERFLHGALPAVPIPVVHKYSNP